ncbi:carbohydrate binding domain-containing protein [Clostridium cellulovorans]|uniref:Glucan endo-1,3-beta-D-glucosidase n=2 Tax=Clostridium cellulovorans TaxID=1493 RepID=D9SRI6_CLOC7|nr:carbohydrate binding domain-containing protein [Clostridium cellulovorans]ADL52415.1 Glucan endo-1,3-beta-D-glucosidase [Clostridium cellulovorans 743B]BAV13067.1 laminarinase [Clostridium cellulovorans]
MKTKKIGLVVTLAVAFLLSISSILYLTTKNNVSRDESLNTNTDSKDTEKKTDNKDSQTKINNKDKQTKTDNKESLSNDQKSHEVLVNNITESTTANNNGITVEYGENKGVVNNNNNPIINGDITTGIDNPIPNKNNDVNNGSNSNGNNNSGDINNGDNNGGTSNNNGTNQDKPLWALAWSDEFNGNALDKTKWNFDEGNWGVNAEGAPYAGWGNNEKQNYIAGDNNVEVRDGQLIITAKKEQSYDKYGGPYDYTSAKVKTKDLFSKKYGKFEIKAKLPAGKGLWPAIWMLPEGEKYGQWAASGEIDIMEAWGSKMDSVRGTIHYGKAYPNNVQNGKESSQDLEFKKKHPNFKIIDYHTYSVEWEPNEIRWYIDGDIYQTITNWYSQGVNQPDKYAFPAPFDKNFYLILNLAVGGAWDGDPDSTTVFPKSMAVDYVRVYEKTKPYDTPVDRSTIKEAYSSDAKLPLGDGNFVYNSNFDKDVTGADNIIGVPDTAYWSFLNLPSYEGQASVSIEPINNKNFAHIDISNKGNQDYSLQLIQRVTVGRARGYKLTFDAKSTGDRNISVKIGGDETRGYTAYAGNYTVPLTSEVKTYSYSFNMASETDLKARLEFNVGDDLKGVWIGNVKLEEIEFIRNDNDIKKPLANGQEIYNGTFDLGNTSRMTYWNINAVNGQANASVNENTRELKLDVYPGYNGVSNISMDQRGLELKEKCTYKVSFKGRAEGEQGTLANVMSSVTNNKSLQVYLANIDGSIKYSTAKDFTLSKDMKEYSFEFTPTVSDSNSKMVFDFGGDKKTIYMDDISMIKTKDFVDYSQVGQLFFVQNGDFSDGLNQWDHYIDSAADASIIEENGEAKISVNNPGTDIWHVILQQPAAGKTFDMKAGIQYLISFDARATVNREMKVSLENASYASFLAQTVNLTDKMQNYSFKFTLPSDQQLALKLFMGKLNGAGKAHDVFIDNVKLEVNGASEEALPKPDNPNNNVNTQKELVSNNSFDSTINPWTLSVANWNGGPGADATAEVENSQAKINVKKVGTENWNVQFKLNPLTMTKGHKYKVSFDVKASIQREIELAIQHNGGSYETFFLTNGIVASPSGNHYEYEFTMDKDTDSEVQFVYNLGKVGNNSEIGEHIVYFDNISLIDESVV